MSERGPVYGVQLIDSLPILGGMRQAMPSRRDLEQVRLVNERVAAGYEALLWHYLVLLSTKSTAFIPNAATSEPWPIGAVKP